MHCKLHRIAKNKLQIGKFVKIGNSSGKSVTFLLVCRNLPGKANLKIRKGFGFMAGRALFYKTIIVDSKFPRFRVQMEFWKSRLHLHIESF